METAAKKRNSWASGVIASMVVLVSALVFSSAANASSASHVGPKTRAEVSDPFSSKSIELLDVNPVNATRYYDQYGEAMLECTVAPVKGLSRTVINSLDDFKSKSGFIFKTEQEAATAFRSYQQAAKVEKGIVIGHDLDPIGQSFGGWQAFRMKAKDWTYAINMSWIDGAIDAGKPVLLATPFDKVKVGSVTWDEIMRIKSKGGTIVFGR